MSSVCGILLINFLFMVGGLFYLWHQDWFSCRMWETNDLSNVLVIGDNYETEVLFLIGGFQYITSAIAFNFGYEFRGHFLRNYIFVLLVTFFCTAMIYITFVPGDFSCIWRVNCVNENVRRSVTSETVMPDYFQAGIFGLMIGNAFAISGYEYFVVNGSRRYYATKRRQEKLVQKRDVGVEKHILA